MISNVGWLFRLAVLALLGATCGGCVASDIVGKKAEGEPKAAATFILTASESSYEITRWWDGGQEIISIPRSDLPAGCESARFFLNDAMHELSITEAVSTNWTKAGLPPLPDNTYPPCSLLVSYGSFSEQSEIEGVVVTSSVGIISVGERRTPQPAAWALAPAALVADTYLFLGALVTLPVWAPTGLLLEDIADKRELEAKEELKSKLPPVVSTCWSTIDKEMATGSTNQAAKFIGFKWGTGVDHAYEIKTDDESFRIDSPIPVENFVLLRRGFVQFRRGDMEPLWTSADAVCGLMSGKVVVTEIKVNK